MQTFLVSFFFLLTVSGLEAQAPGAEIRIEIRLKGEPKGPLSGSVALRPANSQADVLRVPLSSGPLLAKLPANTQWTLSSEIPGYWSPQEIIHSSGHGTSSVHTLVLWPTGKVEGVVKLQDSKQKMPGSFEVRLEPPPVKSKDSNAPRGVVACPIGEQGAWVCELPAGTLDVAFRAAGFIPHYRWGMEVRSGKTLKVGTLVLRQGASLVGWVEVEGGTLETGKCVARLEPLLAPGQGKPQIEARLRGATLEQPVNKEGFFQLEGIAPGNYRIEVRQPEYASARAFPIEVWERSETAVKQPLVLRRPLTLDLSISPPVDWLDRPWKVSLQRRSDFSASVEPDSLVESAADRQGRLRIAGQTPGRFHLAVADSQGNNFYSVRDLRIEGPEDARQSIEIDLVTVRGRVSLGEEPLEATLWFGGRFGSVKSQMESDAEGEFQGVLPREGEWKVEIRAGNPPLDTHAKVEVKADDRDEARVEIVLPDTLVFGKVVDESGRPAPGARVTVDSLISITEIQAEKDGTFELRAIPKGKIILWARSSSPEGPLTSDQRILETFDSQPSGPVDLVLRRTKDFSGRIRSSRGPVAGAMVTVASLRPAMGRTESARTGLDGRFSVKVPGKAEMLAVVVSPPGGALKAFQVPAIGDPVVLQVTEEAGDLEVVLPVSTEEAAEKGFVLSLTQDGVFLSPSLLLRWAEGHGVPHITPSGVQAPRLAPGEYEACFGPAAITESHEVADWKSRRAICATGYLSNGSRLMLELKKK